MRHFGPPKPWKMGMYHKIGGEAMTVHARTHTADNESADLLLGLPPPPPTT